MRLPIATVFGFALLGGCADAADGLSGLKLPPGFTIQLYAEVNGARSMVVTPQGEIYVGMRGEAVHRVEDRDKDGTADRVTRVLEDQHIANGLAYKDGLLYVAEQDKITTYPLSLRGLDRRAGTVIYDRLPNKRHHGWRYLAIGPDDKLYVTIGAACNICQPPEPEASIMRMNLDGSGAEIYARGIRNSVGMAFQPGTGALFFTDNGGDNLGDDVPAEELSRATAPGRHFGYPGFAGGDTRAPGMPPPPADAVAPVITFGAHQAPLGVHFYQGGMLPAEYRGDAFVALHGSWNRSEPAGYRVMRVKFDEQGQPVEAVPFLTGWLTDGEVSGRPVDIEELPDGSLLISDDYNDAIWRITYGN
jgi:glucose/arabinose dehydrogenase